MPLKPEHDGDALAIPGAVLFVSKNKKGAFQGLFVASSEGNFVRSSQAWMTATGPVLGMLHGSKVVKVDPKFVQLYDHVEQEGREPSADEVKAHTLKKN